ncbi:high-potential iron-sulfur protein [Nitrosomonas sp.]|uniref:high-potential iron-sulfur protein n=1 Tax=Nitrosomonas sp. TaxID=42353 RepID=UPI003422A300
MQSTNHNHPVSSATQDKPNGSEKCSNCIQFIPGDTSDANGECKVVAGSISPQGWCTAFSPKS